MTTAFTPTWMPCVVTHSRSSSASWMSSDSRRTFCTPGTTNAPLPTTILKPSPAASPSGPWCARTPEMMSASFGSATLYMNMTACSFLGSVALGERAHDDRPGRLVLEHDDAGAALDALLLVGGVREVRLAAPADRDHHLTELSRLDGAGDAAPLPDQLVVGDHPDRIIPPAGRKRDRAPRPGHRPRGGTRGRCRGGAPAPRARPPSPGPAPRRCGHAARARPRPLPAPPTPRSRRAGWA